MEEAVNNVYLRKLADIQVLYTSFTGTEIWYKCVPNQPPSLLHNNMINIVHCLLKPWLKQ
jgi:hypothetical protein